MVHDHQREWAVADRADQISEHRQRQRKSPDLLLDADLIFGARRRGAGGDQKQGACQKPDDWVEGIPTAISLRS